MLAASVAACCSCSALIWSPEPAKNANRAHGARGWIRGPWSALRYASAIGAADGCADPIPDVRLSIWPVVRGQLAIVRGAHNIKAPT